MRVHIVQKGDTLWKIAKQYSIGFEELKRLNAHLANPDYIVPGMEIYLPDGQHVKERPKEHMKEHIKEKVESPRRHVPPPAPPKIEQPIMPPMHWQPQQPVWPEFNFYMPWHIDMTQMQTMPQQPIMPPPQIQQPIMPLPEVQQPIMPPPKIEQPIMPMPELQQPIMPPPHMMFPPPMPCPSMCMPPMPMMCCPMPMPTPYDMMMYPQMQQFPSMPPQQLAEMEQQASPMMEPEMRTENYYEEMNQPCPCSPHPQMMPMQMPCQPMPFPPWHY
ncbi:LysM peptidoglycan-binding domain-containing protein [Bacillus ndiopicus]|uniref:LysM peptidoglycan-binding domain-containing protein n=1 Tax=Bacillus ndiopicus TaxID=1347368 RepID=UPI0005A7FCD3|nr:LysM domain-containing protein [Bacillus ndiopicus]